MLETYIQFQKEARINPETEKSQPLKASLAPIQITLQGRVKFSPQSCCSFFLASLITAAGYLGKSSDLLSLLWIYSVSQTWSGVEHGLCQPL